MIRKKLIEVALPLEAINIASAREKSIRHGHPSTLHLWWARRPLATARAVIFAQMVDDPSSCSELFPTERKQEKERQRLFKIIEELVKWENTNNETVLNAAREEIWQSWRRACADNADHPQAKELFNRNILPAFHDPFAGGGAIPLEAQRLGLESYASDLNPVAVLINKAMIEIPPKFFNLPPVNPEIHEKELFTIEWNGTKGLAEDVRYYGQWIQQEAEKRIGYLYPKVKITSELVAERQDLKYYEGQELTVIAWIWARTIKSPNPAFSSVDVPLVSNFFLSTKKGKEAYVQPVVENNSYGFSVKFGKPIDPEIVKRGTKSGSSGSNFICLMSGTPMPFDLIREYAKKFGLGQKLMAVVAEGSKGRVYLSPSIEMEEIALKANPVNIPDTNLPEKALGFRVQEYGMTKWCDLFTSRQLVALSTYTDLVCEVREYIQEDAVKSGFRNDNIELRNGGTGALAYAEAISVYLGFAVDRCANTLCTIARWTPDRGQTVTAFSRQAIPMTWDFPDVNPFSGAAGDYLISVEGVIKGITATGKLQGFSFQANASTQSISLNKVISTDPPYYDNIGYADLSDFFYVWMRKSLKTCFPDLFATLAVPKVEELVATPFRHGNRENAELFFLNGMTGAMQQISNLAHPSFPVTIYYAFKQSESDDNDGTASTGWETFLDAVIKAGFSICGTWPIRTEMGNRMISRDTNALASSIIIVCRKQNNKSNVITKKEFINTLNIEMPIALRLLQEGNTAPVDMAQASIGPGMAIFTKNSKVLDSEGNEVTVYDALTIINDVLDKTLAEQEGDFDADTRFALAWFEQSSFDEGDFGIADVLARAKVTSVQGLVDAGVLYSVRGKVRLLKTSELPDNWDPTKDDRLTIWECVHHLIKRLESGGEQSAAELALQIGSKADIARELAYRLYSICERKKRSQEALGYNALVQSWPEIQRLAQVGIKSVDTQTDLFE